MSDRGNILIIDDDRDQSELLRFWFDSKGYNVQIAHTGRAGLDAASQSGPDVILLDVLLPDMDGFEVCRALQDRIDTQQTAILFLTIRDERAERIEGLNLGAVDYITKPYDLEVLGLQVANLLKYISRR